ncbi:MAG: phosphoglycerate kinase [Verrucomicrobia bacterium]|nr:phosphoglycerate kinase [Verrucomicrobiota bacterium]MBS0647098.1 phosphoglycerate kinase [Verrucomicrobiota bacterium]
MTKLFVEQLQITGKRVLVRVDFNVPLGGEGNVLDATRIDASIPTIRYILSQGGSVILMSHLGRPQGAPDPAYSLKPCVSFVKAALDKPVTFIPNCIGRDARKATSELKPGNILMLENLRFYRAEEFPEEDPEFAQTLASYGDLYVNDAFGTAHRKHSSTYTITQYFSDKAAAGYLLQKEINFIGSTLSQPKRPFYALIGGAKISTKIGVLRALLERVDALLIGGAMSYTFLKAMGREIGNSLCETELVPVAEEIIASCNKKGIKLLLPVDVVAAESESERAKWEIISTEQGIPAHLEGVDIGPKTVDLFSSELKTAKTILWNGPLGIFEMAPFAKGTFALARAIAASQAVSIIGGGDLISAVNASGVAEQMTHLSTGGGATLEYIEYGTLPAIEALSEMPASSRPIS